jgi:DNA-binding SARP family transcriptional activator
MDGARPAGTKAIALRLLGPIEAERDGVAAGLGGPKPRALLSVLALDLGRVVSVDHLVDALWPGDAPHTAPHAVQVYVSQLRKALGPVIATRPPGYVLELAPDHVDVHRFTRLAEEGRGALQGDDPESAETALREALALWRGPALADFVYEPFAQTEIARLEELRTVVVEERIEADLALGRHAELVSELEALVQAQPHRERPRAQLMLALYRSGRQADALGAYRSARDVLVDELGIEPGPELKELEAAILRQDASLLLEAPGPAKPAMQYRRLASILFVDVVESMALGERLDPEALGSVQRRYFETVSAALTRHGGTVEKYAGDAVMAAFGVPVSHEDDALRAARAAFEIQAGIEALNEQLVRDHGIALEIRIGIAAGEVVATSAEGGQRFVAGDPVGISARLQREAEPGEIVVGEVVARLIDHAAQLEARDALEIPGRQVPFATYVLREITSVAPAFERHLDAPLVGRKRELAAVRKTLKRAIETGSPRLVVVTGPAGIGKSRLAEEFARRAKGVTRLSGRCLSYGDGITYWPLRELLDGSPPGEERDAVLDALAADTPPPAPEIAWLFRQFCERSAREKPLVIVFDDVHWAEPTFLELVEHLVDRGKGPILAVCVAREELLEERPAFVEERENADVVELDTLSADQTDALLEGLGGAAVLESDQRARIVETAEGHPFFLEQLLALALEGGLVAQSFPETVQALLAARLERLGPGERAVLERGAVIGKEFRMDDVSALVEPEAAPTVATHLESLSARGFVRPAGEEEFGFRHVLLQEAVYRAAPKRLRAELHERFVDRFEERHAGTGDVDEFAGYHLEQAYRLRTELGESDRRTAQLAEDAGRRLGEAGVRALKRGDMHATANLLGRAVALLPSTHEKRNELMCELGIAQYAAGEAEVATASFHDAISDAAASGQRRVELRARVDAAWFRLLAEPDGAPAEFLALANDSIPTFEAVQDDRSLARAWLLIGYVRGGIHGNHAAWQEAEERALEHYRRTAFPVATCLGQIAAALYWGPTPVPAGIERCGQLLMDEAIGLSGRAAVIPYLGGLHAQVGRFSEARELVAEAEHTYRELGAPTSAIHCGTVRADVELLAGDLVAAEQALREQCEYLAQENDRTHLAVRAAKLAETLYRQARFDEAAEWAGVSRANAASDDQSAQLTLWSVDAKLLAREGAFAEARTLMEATLRLGESTDGLNQQAATRLAYSEVLRMAGLDREADRAMERAIALFELKANLVGARQARDRLGLQATA